MKYLMCVLVACVAWIGGTASAAPTGRVGMGELPYIGTSGPTDGGRVFRFADVGPEVSINCYVAVWGDYLEMQCLQVKP